MGVIERKIDVSNVKLHPKYKDPQQYYDVALIFLDEVNIDHLLILYDEVLLANNVYTPYPANLSPIKSRGIFRINKLLWFEGSRMVPKLCSTIG